VAAGELAHGLSLAIVFLESRDDELILADGACDEGLWAVAGPEVSLDVRPDGFLEWLWGFCDGLGGWGSWLRWC